MFLPISSRSAAAEGATTTGKSTSSSIATAEASEPTAAPASAASTSSASVKNGGPKQSLHQPTEATRTCPATANDRSTCARTCRSAKEKEYDKKDNNDQYNTTDRRRRPSITNRTS